MAGKPELSSKAITDLILVVYKFSIFEIKFFASDSMLTTKISDPPYSCVSLKQHRVLHFNTFRTIHMLHEHAHNVVSLLDDAAHDLVALGTELFLI